MVNRKQFSRKFAERYGVTYQDADQICRNAFELLGSLLYEEQEDVVITGFGAFKQKKAKAKNVRHPSTGEMLVTPERDFVKFTPSELLGVKED